MQIPCRDTYAPICKIIGDQNKNTNQFTQKVFKIPHVNLFATFYINEISPNISLQN
jgi:hypothetical protein